MTPNYRTTAIELPYKHKFIDRETGKEIQLYSSDLVVSSTSLSLTTDLTELSLDSLIAFLKCWFLLQKLKNLSEKALQEAAEELEEICNFYSDYSPPTTTNKLEPQVFEATIMPAKIRPPIVLDS
ncbi:hypothetical protein [Cyanothece sp. BG0011]|uniref:hypothetical protein n=1 Tax=Cyanothece sp. BG0011 TaxID=2082950 RepID=UPI000D1F50D4